MVGLIQAELGWVQVLVQVPVLLLIGLIGFTAWKLAPTWKEWKLAQKDVQLADVQARKEAAQAMAAVGHALESVARSLEVMTADHRQLTETNEEMRLFLRVATKDNREVSDRVSVLERGLLSNETIRRTGDVIGGKATT